MFVLDYLKANSSQIVADRTAKAYLSETVYEIFDQSFRVLRYLNKAGHIRQLAEVRIKVVFALQAVHAIEKKADEHAL